MTDRTAAIHAAIDELTATTVSAIDQQASADLRSAGNDDDLIRLENDRMRHATRRQLSSDIAWLARDLITALERLADPEAIVQATGPIVQRIRTAEAQLETRRQFAQSIEQAKADA